NEVGPSHGWITDHADGTETAVADLPAATPALPLALNATNGAFVGDGPYGAALHMDGTDGAFGRTASGAVDPTQSFSVVVFARHTAFASGDWQNLVVQEAGTTESFGLATDPNNHLLFCLQSSQPADGTFDGDCAWSGNSTTMGAWDVVVAVWDAPAHELRLYLNGTLIASRAHATTPATTGSLDVGCGDGSSCPLSCWNAALADPVVYPGVLDQDQFDYIPHVGFGG